ncbi:MAG TPA: hypothetical protein VFW94_10610 [Candidatus Acidoferrales bacterium]|nr:hypothetical protein [Candidatus Acidoferrales bacterium]
MSDKLEQELKKALRRADPPEGFAERVLARTAKEESKRARERRRFQWFGMSGLRLAVTCALCLIVAASGLMYQHERYERHQQGEQAKEQLMLALRITSSKLELANQGIRQINSPDQRPE